MPAEPAGRAIALPDIDVSAAPASGGLRLPVVSLGIIAVFVLLAILAPLLSPADPHDQSLRNRFKPPVWQEGGTWKYPLGTDRLGRDMLSRIVWGSRVSLAAGVVTVLVASAFGAAVGLVAGYYGGGGGGAPLRLTHGTPSLPPPFLAPLPPLTPRAAFSHTCLGPPRVLLVP